MQRALACGTAHFAANAAMICQPTSTATTHSTACYCLSQPHSHAYCRSLCTTITRLLRLSYVERVGVPTSCTPGLPDSVSTLVAVSALKERLKLSAAKKQRSSTAAAKFD